LRGNRQKRFIHNPTNTKATVKKGEGCKRMVLQKRVIKRSVAIALAAVCIVALIGLGVLSFMYLQVGTQLQDKNQQILDLQNQQNPTPSLISIELKYTDNHGNSPSLRITGYIVNVGNTKANNCTLHVNAIQNANATAIDTTANLEPLEPGAYKEIDLTFPYTGQALVAYNSRLEWTN